jgi:ABC-type multidrug transport system permease subunit
MDFKKHLETAWNLSLKNLAPLILMTLVMLIVSFLTVGILAPVMKAGYIQSVLMMVRNGRQPTIQDLFSHMNLFLPLLGFSILVFIALAVGFMLFVLPGIAVVFAVAFGCLYMLPLMTDQKKGLVEALRKSWEMAMQPNVADHVVVVILFVGLIAIGSSVFIGTLFTLPFATVFLASVYIERMEEDQASAPAVKPNSNDIG